ncbi:MAG: DUF1592 domain-containing protein [Opitutae bacterium]|nr:DUF1592 domain-containing protein [Opitutae bacterium]
MINSYWNKIRFGAVIIVGLCPHLTVAQDYKAHILPLLEQYCYDCHGDGASKGDVSLEIFENDKVRLTTHSEWERVWSVVEAQQMPPQNKKQPSRADRLKLMDWIEKAVFKHDCASPDPGRVTIRRLNRVEYGNTVRDLFGLRKGFRPEENFAVDDSGYGFDNIGDVLTVPPVLMEKYLKAADQILEEALVLGPPIPPQQRFIANQFDGYGSTRDDIRVLVSQGETFFHAEVPQDGEYLLYLHSFGDQVGREPVRAGFFIDGKPIGEVKVSEKRNAPGTSQIKLRLNKGRHKFGVSLLNDYYNPKHPDPKQRDRNLYVHWIRVEGPLNKPLPPPPESHAKIFFLSSNTLGDNDKVAREILSPFASRAFRRPASKNELDRLMLLFRMGQKDKLGFEKSVALAIKAILVSPSFLFRGEVQPSPDNPHSVHPVDEFALASRLSYFLWSTMPDRELLGLAWKGQLRENIELQVQRMLADNRSTALARNFAGQWLELRNLDNVMPDKDQFSRYNIQLSGDMRQETERFFEHIQRENRSVLEFLEADYTFINERLARHYDIPNVRGEHFRRISLNGTRRGGLLTHASVLTITSNPTRTSPVKRGKWILENLLGLPPPPPDPSAPPLTDDGKPLDSNSLRELMEKHRADSACASCHANMDPMGLALENFDAIGAWRDKDGQLPIDASGNLASGRFINGPDQLRALLSRDYRKEYLSCLTEMLLTYALGRGLEYYDRCTVNRIVEGLEKSEYRFSSLVMALVKSDPFQLRRGDGDRLASTDTRP